MDERTRKLLERAAGLHEGEPQGTPARAEPEVDPPAPLDPDVDAVEPATAPAPTTEHAPPRPARSIGRVLLRADNVHKTYRMGRVDVPVLRGASITVHEGELVAILGASGSGKSTLLHILGGLDSPDSAASTVTYNDTPLRSLSQAALNRYRNRDVGFVFQFYHLLPELNVLQNATVPAMMGQSRLSWAQNKRAVRERAERLLDMFGLTARLRHKPTELSGGERQRVAIARALINQPALLLADEPTGNLDRQTGDAILDSLLAARDTTARAMVIVTHDQETAARADRVVTLRDGQVVE